MSLCFGLQSAGVQAFAAQSLLDVMIIVVFMCLMVLSGNAGELLVAMMEPACSCLLVFLLVLRVEAPVECTKVRKSV